MSTIKVDIVRPVTTDGSLTLQGDSSGSGVTGLVIDSTGTVTTGTLGSGLVFPAGTVINYKFVEIGTLELSGTYTAFNITSAATSTQGLQVITTSFTPKSDNSKIFCQAQLFVQEDTNTNDYAMAALFVDTTNLSQQYNNDRSDGSFLDHVVATLSGEYTNSSTTAKTIQIRVSGNSNDSIDVNVGNRSGAKVTTAYIKTGLSIFEIQQ